MSLGDYTVGRLVSVGERPFPEGLLSQSEISSVAEETKSKLAVAREKVEEAEKALRNLHKLIGGSSEDQDLDFDWRPYKETKQYARMWAATRILEAAERSLDYSL